MISHLEQAVKRLAEIQSTWLCGLLLSLAVIRAAAAQSTLTIDFEKAPISYSDTADSNRVSRLIEKIQAKEFKLEYTTEHGYLRSILAALEIPEASQVLVFSKTSLQAQRISRQNPRAIYFNDDTYVGWIRGSSLMEISTDDPKLGAAFYAVDMTPWRAKIKRADYDCLGCHATSMTQGIPGHTVRSVFPNFDGSVDPQSKSFITDDSSPFDERWGGWYVTGTHGDMQHMGNAFVRGHVLEKQHNGNRRNLDGEFDTRDYLSPYSDIVALMVLEHQTQTYNTMTRADFAVRLMLHERAASSPSAADEREFQTQVRLLAEEVVDELLFCDEVTLPGPIKGSTGFARQFSQGGPQDSQGRSLREFDLHSRMFKYPCSYMVYSPAVTALTQELRSHIVAKLTEILDGRETAEKYKHLTPALRADILAILRETHAEFAM
ncbi:MAG: hypothetical protein R3C53_04510 [Pirellulaceae bacterium]